MRRTGSAKADKKKCDVLFSKIVRSRGYCEAQVWRSDCAGPLQCAHIISRRFSTTRCDERNALALCAGCHHYFTDHPVEWGQFVLGLIGEGGYRDLHVLSQSTAPVDWSALLPVLRARAESLGVAA